MIFLSQQIFPTLWYERAKKVLAKRDPWQNTVKTMSIKMTVSSDGHDD